MWLKLSEEERIRFINLLAFPEKERLLAILRKFSQREDLFIVGGAVRDLFLGRPIFDLDLAVKFDIEKLQAFLSEALGFTPVPLSPEFGIYRLAKGKNTLDLTLYRGETIEEDLRERDFTINALALPLKALFEGPFLLFDPLSGLKDLKEGKITAISERNILSDPLRILRGYRFFSQGLGNLDPETRRIFQKYKDHILYVSPERIQMELKHILLSSKTFETFLTMDEDSVFETLFPEFKPCKGMPQPSFHHLDVFGHLLSALKAGVEILKNPSQYLGLEEVPQELFSDEDFVISCKLGCLFHDLGKGYTFNFNEEEERITFYSHEKIGAELWEKRATLLRFKNEIIERVSRLIRNHMRPCHLLNEKEKGRLTARAKRNLLKDQPELFELWVVALADSMASLGPDKEPDYEERLNALFKELLEFKKELERVEKRERLLTGKDLINLGFKPGPIFKKILDEVEVKALEGELKGKEEAIKFVLETYKDYL